MVGNVKKKRLKEGEEGVSKEKVKGVVMEWRYVKGVGDGMVLEEKGGGGGGVKEGRRIYVSVRRCKVGLVKLGELIEKSCLGEGEGKLKGMGLKVREGE